MNKLIVAAIITIASVSAHAGVVARATVGNTNVVLTDSPVPDAILAVVPTCRGGGIAATKTLNLPALGGCYTADSQNVYLHTQDGAFRIIARSKFQDASN
jgi:hypothetical protein